MDGSIPCRFEIGPNPAQISLAVKLGYRSNFILVFQRKARNILMKLISHLNLNRVLVFLFICAASMFYWQNIDTVPFHPDEATQIYMSADVNHFLSDPLSLSWTPQNANKPESRLRLLDAPLTRYSIGLLLKISNLPPLSVDWNWTETWQQNQSRGALPSTKALHTARIAVAWVFPLSLLMLYAIAARLMDERTAWLSLFLFTGNALILLHTRRAMAESLLVFTILVNLFLLVFLKPKHLYFLGITTALAVCAKQSTAVLIPLNFLAVMWFAYAQEHSVKNSIFYASAFLGLFTLVFFALDPVFWLYPLQSAQEAIFARRLLLESQVAVIQSQNPEQILSTFPLRIANLIAHGFFTSPMIAESRNYLQATRAAELAYFAEPLHTLFRSVLFGAINLILTLTGSILALLKTIRDPQTREKRTAWMLAAGLFIILGLVWMVPLPWQRYVIPLVPLNCLFAAWPFQGLIQRRKSTSIQ